MTAIASIRDLSLAIGGRLRWSVDYEGYDLYFDDEVSADTAARALALAEDRDIEVEEFALLPDMPIDSGVVSIGFALVTPQAAAA